MSATGFLDNICLLTDSYKLTHFRQYPPRTTKIYSYFESRVGARYPETVFFGLQYFLERYLAGPVATRDRIDVADRLATAHFGRAGLFHRAGWERVVDRHGGMLPVSIRAVPEGTAVPTSNVLMTIENTDPECWWLPNFLETLLVEAWYPCTVATRSRFMRQTLARFLEATGSPELVEFKLHDFGFRGVSCPEQAALGGASHLVNFQGTDNLAALLMLREFYDCDVAGFSIPASEHSTITTWGEAHEVDAMRNMLEQYPEGIVACVSDSFDIFRACRDYWGTALKPLIESRNGVLVVRPDSGKPTESVRGVLEVLGERFGTCKNAKGFKVLPDCVRVIQGDGIDDESIGEILEMMQSNGWSADNIAFGSGGGLLQKLDRDTQRFAFKCSYAEVNGEGRDVYKRPATDPTKDSKRGRLKLVNDGGWRTIRETEPGTDLLEEVFRDGRILRRTTLTDVRKRAASSQ